MCAERRKTFKDASVNGEHTGSDANDKASKGALQYLRQKHKTTVTGAITIHGPTA